MRPFFTFATAKPDHTATALTKEYIPIVPKPKFLEQLESYLSKELRLLGCPSYGPHELRLQAHREVFEYLIEDFKTYKPLLSAIKNEYELYLDYQEELIKELEPMRVLCPHPLSLPLSLSLSPSILRPVSLISLLSGSAADSEGGM